MKLDDLQVYKSFKYKIKSYSMITVPLYKCYIIEKSILFLQVKTYNQNVFISDIPSLVKYTYKIRQNFIKDSIKGF